MRGALSLKEYFYIGCIYWKLYYACHNVIISNHILLHMVSGSI